MDMRNGAFILGNAGPPDFFPAREFVMFLARVAAGFPSPADDYVESPLDLNEFLVTNPPATFFVRASGDSMIGSGIHSGDVLVVDRSRIPGNGNVVIAAIDGQLTVKRFQRVNGVIQLLADNSDYPPIVPEGEETLEIWGVVKHVIHSLV